MTRGLADYVTIPPRDEDARPDNSGPLNGVLCEGLAKLFKAEANSWRTPSQVRQRLAFLGDRIVDVVLAEHVLAEDTPLDIASRLRSNKNMARAVVKCGLHRGTNTGSSDRCRGTLYEAIIGSAYVARGEIDDAIRTVIVRTLVHRDWTPNSQKIARVLL